jgi:hypothetical protein
VTGRVQDPAASAARVPRVIPGDANSTCWPLAVSARVLATALTWLDDSVMSQSASPIRPSDLHGPFLNGRRKEVRPAT